MVNKKIIFLLFSFCILFGACKEQYSEKIKHSTFSLKLGNTWQAMALDTLPNTGYFTAENKKISKSGILTLTYTKDPISTINYLNSMKTEIEQNPIYQLGDTKFEIAKPFKKGQTSGEMVEYHSNLQGLEVGGLIFVTQCGQYSYCFLYQQNKNKHLISNFESLISGFECKAN